MPEIDHRYASPGLRWSLLLEDHPGATKTFTMGTAGEQGVPAAYGADKPVCVATIAYPDGRSFTGYKLIKPQGDPDDWNQLCTKTLGRALKAAGYPDHTPDLKAVVLWRQRLVELRRLEAGTETLASLGEPDAAMEKALDAASGKEGDDGDDDAPATGDDAGDHEGKASPPPAQPTRNADPGETAAVAHLRPDGWDLLDDEARAKVEAKAAERGWTSPAVRALCRSLVPTLPSKAADPPPERPETASGDPGPQSADDDETAAPEACARLLHSISVLDPKTRGEVEQAIANEGIDLEQMPTVAQYRTANAIVLDAAQSVGMAS